MPTIALSQIDVGGPCKVTDFQYGTFYFEEGVKLTPEPTWRGIGTSVGGEHDDVLVDLVWKVTGRPKSVWSYNTGLIPAAYTNWTVAGTRLCGSANRAVSIVGSDSNGFTGVRGCLTKMPEVFAGVGAPLYGEAEWTLFVGTGKALTAEDAFLSANTTAWTQADYPATHQEVVCTGAWGSVTGWDTVFAEDGFKLSHELKLAPVKQGNITVDYRIQSYRAMISFTPQQPTTAQLLSALALQGASGGIGTRRSAGANAFVVTGTGISITQAGAGLRKGEFVFDSKANRHGEVAMVTAMTAPGTRLTLA